ncbi:MAG: hypothetical protein ABEI53_02685, partial [Candidatus Magasanikbacteria bacterium]
MSLYKKILLSLLVFGFSFGVASLVSAADVNFGKNLNIQGNHIKDPAEVGEPTRYSKMNSVYHVSWETGGLQGWTETKNPCGSSGVTTNPTYLGSNPIGDYALEMEGNDEFTSPTIDLSDVYNPVLSFYFVTGSTEPDEAHVEVSTDGGSSWTTVENVINDGSSLFYERIDLSGYGNTSSFKFRFRGASGCGDGFVVDNVNIGPRNGPGIDSTGTIRMNSNKIIGLATPTNASDAATKSYVDSTVSGGT